MTGKRNNGNGAQSDQKVKAFRQEIREIMESMAASAKATNDKLDTTNQKLTRLSTAIEGDLAVGQRGIVPQMDDFRRTQERHDREITMVRNWGKILAAAFSAWCLWKTANGH